LHKRFCTKFSKYFEIICSKIIINFKKYNNITSCISNIKKIVKRTLLYLIKTFLLICDNIYKNTKIYYISSKKKKRKKDKKDCYKKNK